MNTAKQVAEYYLTLIDSELGENLTNLKIQKLVYYTQGFSLAMFDRPIFEEPILAWEHGPVIESLYQEYKQFGANALPLPEKFDEDVFTQEQKDLMTEIYDVYGQFSAWKLRNMTHSEPPWNDTDKNDPIDLELMRQYFKTQLS